MKQPIPNEIINHIMSFRTKNPVFLMFQDSFVFYMDTNKETKGNYLDRYCYDVSFNEWYFCIVKKKRHLKQRFYNDYKI